MMWRGIHAQADQPLVAIIGQLGFVLSGEQLFVRLMLTRSRR